MDWSLLTPEVLVVLFVVLAAEASNGLSDAPVGTSAAVASGALTSRQALLVTAVGNFLGLILALILGAAVAKTIGTGIVQPSMITISSIGVAMFVSFSWAMLAVRLGLPVSKTHSLLAALAGIGFAQGGFEALMPASGNWADSGWVAVGKGIFFAIICGSAVSWFFARTVRVSGLSEAIPEAVWKKLQFVTVAAVASGHGFNDGLKYVGIFTLVLLKAGILTEFHVLPEVIILCAVVMGAATLIGGWRIHRRIEGMVNDAEIASKPKKKPFEPYMGVTAELFSAFGIWQTGFLGIPMSTNHMVVSSIAGAKSSSGKVHINALVKIIWGWIVTYIFCFFFADLLTGYML